MTEHKDSRAKPSLKAPGVCRALIGVAAMSAVFVPMGLDKAMGPGDLTAAGWTLIVCSAIIALVTGAGLWLTQMTEWESTVHTDD